MSETINDGGPAFPGEHVSALNDGVPYLVPGSKGMSLLDWFAGQAMKELIHRREMTKGETYTRPQLAYEAYKDAREMLKERERLKIDGE